MGNSEDRSSRLANSNIVFPGAEKGSGIMVYSVPSLNTLLRAISGSHLSHQMHFDFHAYICHRLKRKSNGMLEDTLTSTTIYISDLLLVAHMYMTVQPTEECKRCRRTGAQECTFHTFQPIHQPTRSSQTLAFALYPDN